MLSWYSVVNCLTISYIGYLLVMLGRINVKSKYANFSSSVPSILGTNGYYGFTDLDGMQVIAPQWKEAGPFSEGLAAVKGPDNHRGYIDQTGRAVIPLIYNVAGAFKNGMALVMMNGCVDGATQRLVIQPEVSHNWGADYIRFHHPTRWGQYLGVIDKHGRWVIPCSVFLNSKYPISLGRGLYAAQTVFGPIVTRTGQDAERR